MRGRLPDGGDKPRQFDTVVFVHGILGASTKTWGNFPQLLSSDVDLAEVDVLCWGYQSSLVPGTYADVELESQALMSGLGVGIDRGNQIFLVGHSMGGLVILKGLTEWLRQGRDEDVIAEVRRVTLYATPLKGSAVANVVHAAGLFRLIPRILIRFLPIAQLRDLRVGTFVDELIRDVVADVLPREGPKIRTCPGLHDRLVTPSSAVGPFHGEPNPVYLEGGHGSVKLPETHFDVRYRTLKCDLIEMLTERFCEVCRTLQNPTATRDQRGQAARQFWPTVWGAYREMRPEVLWGPGRHRR